VTAPFKHAFFLKMIEHFSEDVESMVIVPSYPHIGEGRARATAMEKAAEIVLGDKHIEAAISEFRPGVAYADSALYGSQVKMWQRVAKWRIPTIVHLRGDLWREFFEWMTRSPIKTRLAGLPVYANSMLGLLLADKITPICRWLDGEVLRHLSWKSTEVVYQGVDPSDFFQTPNMDLAHPSVAIIQNHTVYQKTLGLLKFKRVIERLPDVHFYVTTGEEIRQSYFPLVREALSEFKNVHFVSGIHHPDGVRKLLSNSDLYALPSCLDCCPTTILEASLMEKPVLGSRIGGIPEIIRDGCTGWSIQNDDIEGWVDKIRLLTGDVTLSRKLGRQGRRWVSDNFGWSRIAAQVENMLKEF
jgi:glycosyltransferase involved in cell wall biosynthesis